MNTNKLWWMGYALKKLHTGSRVICSPPPTNTDDDYLLLIDPDTQESFEKKLSEEGFKIGGSFNNPVKGKYIIVWENKVSGNIVNADSNYLYEGYYIGYETSGHRLIKIIANKPETNPNKLESWPDWSKLDKSNLTHIFHSWKIDSEDKFNLIITASPEYFENFYKATLLSKHLNLKNKADRISVFDAVCYDVWP